MNAKGNCPICNSDSIVNNDNIHTLQVQCESCGKYNITDVAQNYFTNNEIPNKAIILSYWIRKNQVNESFPTIDLVKMKYIIQNHFFPKPKEVADNLLLWMGSNLNKPNDETNIPLRVLKPFIGSVDEEGVKYVADHLMEQNYVRHRGFAYSSINGGQRNPPEDMLKATMTFKGWDRYYELQHSNKDSRLAFMAMKFKEEPLNTIYETVIKQAVSQTGFDIRKLDEEPKAGLIDDKLRVEIRRSKFLIADLTHDNNGAYWEAGFAEGLGMPVIYICEEEKFNSSKSHFDTNHHLTVTWKNDESGLTKFSEDLKATIRATLPVEAKIED